MKKRNKIIILTMLALLFAALFPAAVSAHTKDNPLRAKLMAGKTDYAGHVEVWNDGTNLHVTFNAKWGIGFCLNETHLHVATSIDGIPLNDAGNPKIGKFAYQDENLGCIKKVEYVVPLKDWDTGTELVIAAHAVVGKWTDPYYEETGWGVLCGNLDKWPLPGPSWATYIPYTVQ